MLNLIDISSWQAGLDLKTLFDADQGLDGAMVKLTQGTGYVNPEADAWINWLHFSGKPWGTYHYMDGSGAKAEAQHYAGIVKNYPGGVMALDYEDAVLAHGTGYLLECLDEVKRLTGVRPLVYCSLSVIHSQDFTAIAEAGYRLWMAQYADMREVHGFVDKPWQSGSVAPFPSYTMHQYTSCGRLRGWNGNLDFDKFSSSIGDWLELAYGADTIQPVKGPDAEVVSDVLHGKYGTGTERTEKLAKAGYDAEAVQATVNELYGIALSCRTYTKGYEEYLNSLIWVMRALA